MLREKAPRWWWEAGEEGYRWLAGMLVLLLRRCLSDAPAGSLCVNTDDVNLSRSRPQQQQRGRARQPVCR
ncbi:hypothetical protein EYF80_020928 [Liparis tanakae]|uniref:Secreted protein n=1 Tax=Liparis tanakae TaxID=230148 RepID=A0A4Z2HVA2_9TELE|nr:hypothetical protein EYF80_020928 [Liparis tanakae]